MNNQTREYSRARYIANKARIQESQREYYRQNKTSVTETNRRWREQNRQLEAVSRVASRAKKRGIECDKAYMASLPCPETCPILGIPISFNSAKDKCASASFDRINNELGYVPGNVQIICKLANTMKNKGSETELVAFAKWVLMTFT